LGKIIEIQNKNEKSKGRAKEKKKENEKKSKISENPKDDKEVFKFINILWIVFPYTIKNVHNCKNIMQPKS